MDLPILWREINTDPVAIGYKEGVVFKPDATIAALLNTQNQQIARTSITGAELWEKTSLGELKTLTAAEREAYWGLAGMVTLDVTAGSNSRTSLAALFPAGSTTRTNLIALVATPIVTSRAAILGLGEVAPGHVHQAITQGERGEFG
jgi:hypothetical protein